MIITILAIQDFLCAATALLIAIILLSGAKTAAAFSTLLSRTGETVTPDSLPFELRLKYALLCVLRRTDLPAGQRTMAAEELGATPPALDLHVRHSVRRGILPVVARATAL
ncbi:MAG TPA: hypothetical protein VFR24_28020 [Candidatus Angelobacter sp.]|nr:hypothetical protein [Candidatus Angelobacter sp.]